MECVEFCEVSDQSHHVNCLLEMPLILNHHHFRSLFLQTIVFDKTTKYNQASYIYDRTNTIDLFKEF